MIDKIIAIGTTTDRKRKIITGQSMMFDATVEILIEKGYTVQIVNLTSKYTDFKVGKINTKRIFEYFSIIIGSIPKFYKNRGGILYIATAQVKSGFLRDFVFVHLAAFFRYRILIQQLGSNFEVFYNGSSPFFKFLIRITFNKGKKIIVEGEFSKKQFSMFKNYEYKVVSIPNGLPERELKTSLTGKTYKKDESFTLLYLNNMIESKGYWDVLEAMDILINKLHRNVSCIFVGVFMISVDDERFSKIEDAKLSFKDFIKNKSLNNCISYYNGLIGADKADVFLKSNVFLLPSYYKFEGQPIAVLEALAYGSVPIVTNYRMIPTMVTDECGLFVEKKSPNIIAEKISFLMDNPDKYKEYSQAGVNRYNDFFTLDKYCNSILNLISSI